ncbi:nicotinate-nucleotide--dimethylbenzimidazole phosphoribosyltransferase [Aquimarina pacifica]|uniref:nicotinate-nucleotide--dimethylbenzimidazole phosphoribosyltransferase n=1 Tax=Aquimarina pacifica TaxID=1296415 RepID=UPI0004B75038|nr:nicotinate-nucleotide--dimethylbenzimidazole phosphoribosyltransferase [Aquimarina pacifica]
MSQIHFDIQSILDISLEQKIQSKIDNKTKPLGALGILEKLALQIGMIQGTHQPYLSNPTILVFAGDHGISKEGVVNPYPQEVTAQMVYNFLNEGAAINVFCKQNDIELKVIDAGVHHIFGGVSGLINAKIDMGTKNYQYEPAMSIEQCIDAINKGAEIVSNTQANECNCIGFGEMGIGNTSAASLLMAYTTKLDIADCVGAGTGLPDKDILRKREILETVFKKYHPTSTIEALAIFGGFEIAMITGGILKAAENKMTILIDGFIVTAALLIAHKINKNVLDYCIFAHTSGEQGHQKMLDFLGQKPIVDLDMRLGEGTGAAIVYPILQSSVAFLNTMASFEEAEISKNDH